MKQTTNYNLVKPELTDSPPDITVMNPNWDKIDAKLKEFEEQNENLEKNLEFKADLIDGKVSSEQLPEMDYLSYNGDGGDVIVTFTEAGSRLNINTAEKLSVLFGKIKKYFTDLKIVAFTGSYSDLSGTPSSLPANGGTAASCSGNSATATKLQTTCTINGVAFDGSQNITIADSTKAPINHKSTNTSYGVGDAFNYGHVKVRNDLVGTETNGATVSPAQIKILNDKVALNRPVPVHITGNAPTGNDEIQLINIDATAGYRVISCETEVDWCLFAFDGDNGILAGTYARESDRIYYKRLVLSSTKQYINYSDSATNMPIYAWKTGGRVYFSVRGSTQGVGRYKLDIV